MDDMEKILKKASELGHLLAHHEIVKRYRDLSERMEMDEEARKLLEELIAASHRFEQKERAGTPIEAEEKKQLAELQERSKENSLVSEFLATQVYYLNVLTQVNEAIASPKGEPPRDSNIILPGDEDRGIIIS